MTASLSAVARRFLFVRETDGANDGAWVTFFQRFTGNDPGDSWCASFVSVVEDIATKGNPPVRKSASCQDRLDEARRKGLVVSAPRVDDVFYYVNEAGHAHHTGIVTATLPLTGIAGNTSEDGTSSDGTGVYEHAINPRVCVYVRPR